MIKIKRVHVLVLILALSAVALPFKKNIRQELSPLVNWVKGRASVADRIDQYGAGARFRLKPYFAASGLTYPPAGIVLVGLKEEKMLEVWAKEEKNNSYTLIRTYPVLGASGELGPKLREGDMQVPEGVYGVESLNPNSRYHLSMRLNYPNDFDLEHAKQEGRKHPGGDIMIHGKMGSIGCLAMGDKPIEELFVLAADTGIDNIKVILVPLDLRKKEVPKVNRAMPVWADDLYGRLRNELGQLKFRKL